LNRKEENRERRTRLIDQLSTNSRISCHHWTCKINRLDSNIQVMPNRFFKKVKVINPTGLWT
jgi:hypothetical protein